MRRAKVGCSPVKTSKERNGGVILRVKGVRGPENETAGGRTVRGEKHGGHVRSLFAEGCWSGEVLLLEAESKGTGSG